MEQNKYLYFAFQSSQDVEPTEKELKSFQRKYKKDYTTRELYEGEELLNEYRLRGWKHPRYSKIISFILAFESEGKLRVQYITGEEKDLLQNFSNILRKSQDFKLVSFSNQIILPYLGIRMVRNNFLSNPHPALNYKNMRPWDLKAIDLQQYYDGAGDYRSSIKDIADDFGFFCDDIIEIEDEFTYYNSKDFDSLKQSAIRKIEVISKAHRLLNNLPELETVFVEESVKDVEEEKPKDWLKELYYANELTEAIKDGLRQQILGGKKKPTKKDKENLRTIMLGAYRRTDFINKDQDSKDTIARKEKEINELINSL